MTEKQHQEQDNVSLSYLLELTLSQTEYSAMDWLTDVTHEPKGFEVPEFTFYPEANTLSVTIAHRSQLNWLEFYAQHAEATTFSESSTAAEKQGMHDLGLTLRKAIGLVKLQLG
jgi:hypothetical protein